MIIGFDVSSWTTVHNSQAMLNDQLPADFIIPRGWDGYQADSKAQVHISIGAALRTLYGFIAYAAQVDGRTWSPGDGNQQAENFWNISRSLSQFINMPLALDYEQVTYIEKTTNLRKSVPLPPVRDYCDRYLLPSVQTMKEKMGRYPLFYSNPNFILNYLAPVLEISKYAEIRNCPLWLAGYTGGSVPPYWEDTRNSAGTITKKGVKNYWNEWLIWQYKGDVRDWPGVDDVDLNRAKGTRSQWIRWGADPTAPMPTENPVQDPKPDDGGLEFEALKERLDQVYDLLNRHFK